MKATDFIILIVLSQIKSLLCKFSLDNYKINDVWIIYDGWQYAIGVTFNKWPAINLNCIKHDNDPKLCESLGNFVKVEFFISQKELLTRVSQKIKCLVNLFFTLFCHVYLPCSGLMRLLSLIKFDHQCGVHKKW